METQASVLLKRFAKRTKGDYQKDKQKSWTYFAIDNATHKIIQTTRAQYSDGVLVIGNREPLLQEVNFFNEQRYIPEEYIKEQYEWPKLYLGNKKEQWSMYRSMAAMNPQLLGTFVRENPFNDNMHLFFMKLVQLIHNIRLTLETPQTVDDIFRYIKPFKKRYGFSYEAGFHPLGPVLFRCDRLQTHKIDDVMKVHPWEEIEFLKDAWIGITISLQNLASFRKVYGIIDGAANNTMCLSENMVEESVETWLNENVETIFPGHLASMFQLFMRELTWVGVHCGYVGFSNIAVLKLTKEIEFKVWGKAEPIKLKHIFRVVGYERAEPAPKDFKQLLNKVGETILNLFSRVDYITNNILNEMFNELIVDLQNSDETIVKNYSTTANNEQFVLPSTESVGVNDFPTSRHFEVFMTIDSNAPYKQPEVTALFGKETELTIQALNKQAGKVKKGDLKELNLFLRLLEKAFAFHARCVKFGLERFSQHLKKTFQDTMLTTDLYSELVRKRTIVSNDPKLYKFVEESHEI